MFETISFLNEPTPEMKEAILETTIESHKEPKKTEVLYGTRYSEVVYTHMKPIDPGAYPFLKVVLCPQTDISHLDPEIQKKTIYLTDKEYLAKYVFATAEHTVSLILQIMRKNQAELRGKRLLLIGGSGRVATQVISLLMGFDVDIDLVDRDNIKTLPFFLKRADIVSIHINATEENRNFMDSSKMLLLKPGCFLINTSRSMVVDTKALIQNRSIYYATDVTENMSQKQYDELFGMNSKNIATPHIAGKTKESRLATDMFIYKKFIEWVGKNDKIAFETL